MADILFSAVLDGTTVNCEATFSFSKRTAASVTVEYTAVTYLNSGGYTEAGYEKYVGEITLKGNGADNHTEIIVLKPKSEGWQGSQRHTQSGSFVLNTASQSALTLNAQYLVYSDMDTVNRGCGSCNLSCGAYLPPVPEAVSGLQVSKSRVYSPMSLNVSWGASSGAESYNVYLVLNKSSILLENTTGTTALIKEELPLGTEFRIKVCAKNSYGESAGRFSVPIRVEGGLWVKDGSFLGGFAYINNEGVWQKVKCAYIFHGEWSESV